MLRIRHLFVAVALFAGLLSILQAQAPALLIRVATSAPDKSEWHDALLQLGDSLKKGTANRAGLRINAGGTQGSEKAVIDRMMTGGPVDAALLTANGLALIDDSFNVFGIPFFFESEAELRHVQERLTPMLAAKLEAKRFHLLSWGDGGWVQLFSKKPLKTLAEVKRAKLYTSEGNDRMMQWYKANGFNAVALPDSEIMKQLKALNGIEAVPIPPYPAQLLGLYRDAPNMLQMQVAQLVGAMIITTGTWNKLSEADRKVLTDASKAMQTRLEREVPKKDDASVAEMQKEGRDLKVTALDPKAVAEFRSEAAKMTAAMSGSIVPSDVFDAAIRERNAYRAARPGNR
jgi:TRAP-type C4-dicarboxylate transport system substrate-binding protein